MYKQFHHGDAMAEKRSAHQRPVAALMHVRSVIDHPLRNGQSLHTRRLPGNAAFRDPGERAVFVIAKRSAMQSRIAGHKGFHALEVVGIDGALELSDLFERIDVSLQLRPAGKSIETGNLELRISERPSVTRLEQILGLIFQMPEIGTVRKRTR